MRAQLVALLASNRFTTALSTVIVLAAFSVHAVRSLIGWGGLIGLLIALGILATASFIARRDEFEWHGMLPISLLIFLSWCALSVLWSNYRGDTFAGIGYQLQFALLAVYLAVVRDTIQLVRTVGDVLRLLLSLSLLLEILSGILLDAPIRVLGIVGRITSGGPIQGLFGTRNMLGLVALIAFVTFFVELRTKSISRSTAVFSLVLAFACMALSRSPIVALVFASTVVAMVVLYLVRRAPASSRVAWQLGLGLLAVAAAIGAFAFRGAIVTALRAGNVLQVRYDLWFRVRSEFTDNPLTGWGWTGSWPREFPYLSINFYTGPPRHTNALNAFLDVQLQLGLVGLAIFVILFLLALGRSWLLASNKRTVTYTWMPLVLIVLLATSVAESVTLVEFGWLLLVLCTVRASQAMSWRDALRRAAATE